MNNKLLVSVLSMIASAAATTTAVAQTAEPAYELEEVVVTAELREVNLQKVSTSIQVTSGEELRKEGKKRIDEIMSGTVGIQTQDSQNGVTFFVRGVDSGGADGVNSTPVLVDGVAQSRAEAVRGGTLDMARAEVMRGPQSTTLGANALSGAVSLVSNKPAFQYEGSGSLDFGSYNKITTEGVFNAPIGDNQAVRIAASSEKRDSYFSNGSGNSDLTNARIKYRWQPTDSLDIVGTVSYQNIGGNGVSQLTLLTFGKYLPWVGGSDSAAAYVPGNTLNLLSQCKNSDPLNPALVPCSSTSGLVDPAKSVTFLGYTPYYNGVTLNTATGIPSPLVSTPNGNPEIMGGATPQYYAVDDGTNFRTRANAWNDGSGPDAWGTQPFRNSDIELASVEVNWTTDIGTVRFLPSYQYTHYTSQEPYRYYQSMGSNNYQRTTTLDLLVNSNTGDKLQWQAGAFYSDDRQDNKSFTMNLPGLGKGMSGTANVGDCNMTSSGSVATTTADLASPTSPCYSYTLTPKSSRTLAAVFTNGEYSVLDTVRLIGGLRWQENTQDVLSYLPINGDATGPYADCTVPDGTGLYGAFKNTNCTPGAQFTSTSTGQIWTGPFDLNHLIVNPDATLEQPAHWAGTTYRAGFEWDALPETMLYGVYSTGFNPGAFDSMNVNNPRPAVTLEQLTTGFKSQFMDNRLQFNGEAFYTTYHNRPVDGSILAVLPIGSTGASSAVCNVGMGQTGVSRSLDGNALCLGLGTPVVDNFVSKGIDLDLTWLLSPVDRMTLTGELMSASYDSAPTVDYALNASATVKAVPIYLNGAINPAYVAAVAGTAYGWTATSPEAIYLAQDMTNQLNGFVGTRLQNAPKFSATWAYSHNFLLPNGDRITPRVAGAYKTRYWSVGGGGPGNSGVNAIAQSEFCDANDTVGCPYGLAWQQAYATWDASMAWDKSDGKLSINAYVKNLTNEVVLAGFTYQWVSLAAPRTWGLTLTANF